jgi:hypothetical protein
MLRLSHPLFAHSELSHESHLSNVFFCRRGWLARLHSENRWYKYTHTVQLYITIKTAHMQLLQFLWIHCFVVFLYERQQHPVQRQAGTRVRRQHQLSKSHWFEVKNTPTGVVEWWIMSLCVAKNVYNVKGSCVLDFCSTRCASC